MSATIATIALCLAFFGLGGSFAAIWGAYVLARQALPLIVDLKAQQLYQAGQSRMAAAPKEPRRKKVYLPDDLLTEENPASFEDDLPSGNVPRDVRKRLAMARILEREAGQFDD